VFHKYSPIVRSAENLYFQQTLCTKNAEKKTKEAKKYLAKKLLLVYHGKKQT
jgi:hypothetical protein